MSVPHRRSVAEEPVTSVLPGGDVPYASGHDMTADEEVLAALGYKSEFKREFSLFTTFCVSFAVLGLLPSFASTLYYGMGYAGTAGTWFSTTISVGVVSVEIHGGREGLTGLLGGLVELNWLTGDRYDVGMDYCYDRYPVCGLFHGGAVLFDADEWRIVLCSSSSRAARMGTFCCVDHWLE
jgi:hypothetical protein